MKENFKHQKTFEKIRFNYMPKFSGKIKNVVIILYHHLLNVSKIRTYRIVPADPDGQSDRQTDNRASTWDRILWFEKQSSNMVYHSSRQHTPFTMNVRLNSSLNHQNVRPKKKELCSCRQEKAASSLQAVLVPSAYLVQVTYEHCACRLFRVPQSGVHLALVWLLLHGRRLMSAVGPCGLLWDFG